MARGWSADMEIKKCINNIWRECIGQKKMKALWFGGAVSAGTGLWSHWFMAESGALLLKLCENRKPLVSGSCQTQNLLFNHILRGRMNQWNLPHIVRSVKITTQDRTDRDVCVHALKVLLTSSSRTNLKTLTYSLLSGSSFSVSSSLSSSKLPSFNKEERKINNTRV